MFFFESGINYFIEIIKNDDLLKLKSFIEENNIKFSKEHLNSDNYDILISAINHNASINILKFIINNVKYENLNYIHNNRSPLLIAILKENFKVANFLITKGANVNHIDIFIPLSNKQLNDIIKENKLVLDFSKEFYNKFLSNQVIQEEQINFLINYDNDFLLNPEKLNYTFCSHSVNLGIPTIKKLINHKLFDLKNVKVHYIFKNIMSDYEASTFLIESCFQHKTFDFRYVNIENIMTLIQNQKYFNDTYLLDLVLYQMLKHQKLDFQFINFEEILKCLYKKNYMFYHIVEYYIDKSFQHPTFDFKRINFENILRYVPTIFLLEKVIRNSFRHKTFDFRNINFEECLNKYTWGNKLETYNYDSTIVEILKLMIEEALSCRTFDIKLINLEKIIQRLKEDDRRNELSKTFIRGLFHLNSIPIKSIPLEKIFFE
eukprot:jgi/Orpsp1_1/1183212/evm.model.c7180000084269.1